MISCLNLRCTGILGLGLLISACATYEPVPKGYAGATAKLTDSTGNDADSERCASFFFLDAYDGHDVENSFTATEQGNRGRGMGMTIEGYSRLVPAQEATFHLKARTHCAAPILEVTNKVYMLEGDVRFAPQGDGQYTIKGELGEERSAVWVEDLATGKQLGNKLLVNGSAALNRGALLLLGEAAARSSKQKVEEIPPP